MIWQILGYVLGGLLIIYLIYDMITNVVFKSKDGKTNVDGMVGKNGIIIKKTNRAEAGYVSIEHRDWLSISDEELIPGDVVSVIGVDGAKLIVRKANIK